MFVISVRRMINLLMEPSVSLFFVEFSWSKLSVIPSESPMILNLLPNVQSRILQIPSTSIPRTLSTLSGSKIINKCNDHAIAVDAVLALADLEEKDDDFELIKVESQVGGAMDESMLVKGVGVIVDKDFSHPHSTAANPYLVRFCLQKSLFIQGIC